MTVRLAEWLRHPVVDGVVIFLILLSVGLLMMEELYSLPSHHPVARVGDVITGVFAVELTLRFVAARKKSRFFRRYWPDILAILPVLRPLRVFRFLRLFRLFRLFQLGVLVDRRFSALRGLLRVNVPFLWILLALTMIIIFGGTIFAYTVERQSSQSFSNIREAFWWVAYSLIAHEPIGAMPHTSLGRVLLVGLMLGGSALFAVFTGIVSATMVDRLRVMDQVGELDLDELEDHVVICGWNAGALTLIDELTSDPAFKKRALVLVNELDRLPTDAMSGLPGDMVYHLRGDHAQLDTLRDAGMARAWRAVVLADDSGQHSSVDRDARSVLTALTIERLNPSIYCVVELNHEENRAHLAVAGVEAMITGSNLTGRALAAACRSSGATMAVIDLLSLKYGARLDRRSGPKTPVSYGSLLRQVKEESGALVLGIEPPGEPPLLNPDRDTVVGPEHHVLLVL
ncbi:MAG: ion transporter [Myxococcota bacterium]